MAAPAISVSQPAALFFTPDSALPTTGSATYVGNNSTAGGAIGVYAVNTSDGTLQTGTLSGNVSVTANFGPNTVSGTMTNMSATPTGSSTPTPWNNVTLSGNIGVAPPTRNNIFGTTASGGTPSGALAPRPSLPPPRVSLQAPFMVRMRRNSVPPGRSMNPPTAVKLRSVPLQARQSLLPELP